MMPSRYEPCGLNQMYSLSYGTLPIVHRTGGLADTVENYNQDTGSGTGFAFDHLTPRSIYDTTGWAVWAFYNKPGHIAAMRRRGMEKSFSWDRPAAEYAKLYARAHEKALVRATRCLDALDKADGKANRDAFEDSHGGSPSSSLVDPRLREVEKIPRLRQPL